MRDVGACGLMLQTRAVEVKYMSLAPMLAMAVLEMGISGGVGLQLGREVKTAEIREDFSLFLVKLILRTSPHRQAKSSQTSFLVAPVPAGLSRVAVSMWPDPFFLQDPSNQRFL